MSVEPAYPIFTIKSGLIFSHKYFVKFIAVFCFPIPDISSDILFMISQNNHLKIFYRKITFISIGLMKSAIWHLYRSLCMPDDMLLCRLHCEKPWDTPLPHTVSDIPQYPFSKNETQMYQIR